jgi:hypothetical protein
MQRLKMVGMALVALLAITAIASATASAALPEFSPATNSGTSKGGKAKFEQVKGLAAVECEKSTGTQKITGPKVGSFTEKFEGCKAPLSGKCTGLGDTTAGTITTGGAFDLRYIKISPVDVGVLFLINETHFECEKLIELVSVKGCVVGLITPANSKTKVFTVQLKQTKGVNEFTEVLTEKATKETEKEGCKLLSEMNGAEFKQAGQENTDEVTETTEAQIIA